MMAIHDQIKDKNLQCDTNREAAKISALSSGKHHKYEYLTGEDILPSAQQQIIFTYYMYYIYYILYITIFTQQTKFTYSPLGKAFDKQIKTIEDQGKKQVDALEKLKPEKTKPIEVNQSRARIIFNDLISKRKELMSKLYDSVDYNNLNFEYAGSTKDVSFYEYMDSKKLFNVIKDNQIKFIDARNSQNEFLNKLGNNKLVEKLQNKKE